MIKVEDTQLKKKWTMLNVGYWTTNEKDWERVVAKISKPLKGHFVSELKVFIDGGLRFTTKKWWQFWK